MGGQRPLPGIRHSPTTTPSSDDDGDHPTIARGNGMLGNAIATGNGTHHDANGAAVSGGEAHGEEFVGECRRLVRRTLTLIIVSQNASCMRL